MDTQMKINLSNYLITRCNSEKITCYLDSCRHVFNKYSSMIDLNIFINCSVKIKYAKWKENKFFFESFRDYNEFIIMELENERDNLDDLLNNFYNASESIENSFDLLHRPCCKYSIQIIAFTVLCRELVATLIKYFDLYRDDNDLINRLHSRGIINRYYLNKSRTELKDNLIYHAKEAVYFFILAINFGNENPPNIDVRNINLDEPAF